MNRHAAHKQACSGFTLTELLVATGLLATVTAGGLRAVAQTHAVWRSASMEQRLHERAQYLFATLEPALQMAGYFGIGPVPLPPDIASVPASALSCGNAIIQRLNMPIEILNGLPRTCAMHESARDESQVLVVRRLSTLIAPAEKGRAQWLGGRSMAGQLLWNGETPPAAASTSTRERRNLLIQIYYVARAADGDITTPALRVKSLTSIAGVPAFIDTEVMPGVEHLQVQLFPTVAAPRSVRVTIRLRPDQADLRSDQIPQSLTITRHFTLRNATPD